MNFWIFIVTSHALDEGTYSGEQILQQRFQDQFWGLGEKTLNRKALKAGDEVVFYVGLPQKEFAATATLASDSFHLSEEEKKAISHGTKFYAASFGVKLKETVLWATRRPVANLVPYLTFIENKPFWFTYFQGGVRQLSEDDFRTITQKTDAIPSSPFGQGPRLIESESQFALEAHLEEFIDKNWERIDFGSRLVRFKSEDQNGRQFPAGEWSIDFLCVDKETDDFVVIELKRGKSSDSTVGQVLRYMSWVRENLSQTKQNVKGIIIAKEVDEALRYAVSGLQDVRILTYRIDFELSAFSKSVRS